MAEDEYLLLPSDIDHCPYFIQRLGNSLTPSLLHNIQIVQDQPGNKLDGTERGIKLGKTYMSVVTRKTIDSSASSLLFNQVLQLSASGACS